VKAYVEGTIKKFHLDEHGNRIIDDMEWTGVGMEEEMKEFFVVANSFAAPFFSDSSEQFVTGSTEVREELFASVWTVCSHDLRRCECLSQKQKAPSEVDLQS
jgi:hypothetical protein